jgi:hypothetical protein
MQRSHITTLGIPVGSSTGGSSSTSKNSSPSRKEISKVRANRSRSSSAISSGKRDLNLASVKSKDLRFSPTLKTKDRSDTSTTTAGCRRKAEGFRMSKREASAVFHFLSIAKPSGHDFMFLGLGHAFGFATATRMADGLGWNCQEIILYYTGDLLWAREARPQARASPRAL